MTAATAAAAAGGGLAARLTATDHRLLLELLRLPTAGPLETGGDAPVRLWEAQRAYADAAADLGFTIVHHAAADPGALDADGVPRSVRQAAERMPDFLSCQPSLVLRLGPALPQAATVMLNVHLDTVAGLEPVSFDGSRFHGRGAIDAKGPAVALLSGVRAAIAAEPSLGVETGVVIQAVSGEEGGAMGVYGTRQLVARGHVGRLNLFCEPTGRRLLTRSTAAATARIEVRGRDAVDDRPEAGHNATVLLGFLAQHLAATLPARAVDGRVCVAGLQTGPLHNRVYGTGRLLLNLSYGSAQTGRLLETALSEAVADGLAGFAERFQSSRDFALTAAEAGGIVRVEWVKRGLPALASVDPWAQQLLEDTAGLPRWPAGEPAFTCDAIWMHDVPGAFAAVFGPGDLSANNAHAAGEYADLAELEQFATDIARAIVCFARQREIVCSARQREIVCSARQREIVCSARHRNEDR
jgi:acetylornithine deacetylase/succinyl-diaminopimelate desuccinylase-like protein